MKPFHYLYLILVLGYLLLTMLTPVDAAAMQRYHLSEPQLRLLGMTVSIPLAVIWLVALYGYTRFQAYSDTIAKAKEGKAFKEITKGLMILALSLPATALASSILRLITSDHTGLTGYAVIGRSYLPLIFQLLAFSLLASGSAKLVKLLKPKVTRTIADWVIIGLIAAASLFAYLIVARPFGGTVADNYSLPAWVVVLTLVIPFLFAWYKGGLAIYQLYLYQRRVNGPLYRRIVADLVAGLSTITIIAILIQALVSVTEKLNRLDFTPLLTLVYALVFLYAIGFGLVARGARQLKKIEEV